MLFYWFLFAYIHKILIFTPSIHFLRSSFSKYVEVRWFFILCIINSIHRMNIISNVNFYEGNVSIFNLFIGRYFLNLCIMGKLFSEKKNQNSGYLSMEINCEWKVNFFKKNLLDIQHIYSIHRSSYEIPLLIWCENAPLSFFKNILYVLKY